MFSMTFKHIALFFFVAFAVNHVSAQNVNCAPADDNGSALTGSEDNGGGTVTCRYAGGAGPCVYFSDGGFSSGSSVCPDGVAQGGGGDDETTTAADTTDVVETTTEVPPETTSEVLPDTTEETTIFPETTTLVSVIPTPTIPQTSATSPGTTSQSAVPSDTSTQDDGDNGAASLQRSGLLVVITALVGMAAGFSVL